MKNNKGQALIEFAMILPVILLILMYIIEFGRITLKKHELESNMDLIIDLYKENKQELNTYLDKNNITINYRTQNNLTTIEISKYIKSNVPLINRIMGNQITTKRTIYEATE